VPVAAGHNSVAHDEIRIVDCFCNRKHLEAACRKIGDRIEINHLAIREKERVDRAVVGRREANNLSATIATQRAIWISGGGIDHPCATECSEIAHGAIGIEKGMT
jgi:hypothetical protein